MSVRTYYHILGVSRDATLDEITAAKNALAKVYHPDANMCSGVDTTARMQEILEAYRTLSNPQKRKEYDLELGGGKKRVFRTYKMGEEASNSNESDSFVACWNAAHKLNEAVNTSTWLLHRESKRKSLSVKILEKLKLRNSEEKELQSRLGTLSLQALQYITILKTAGIPMDYWNPEAMNWLLIQWGQNQAKNYQTLLAQYDVYINQNKTNTERMKLHTQNKQFHTRLKKLLTYAL